MKLHITLLTLLLVAGMTLAAPSALATGTPVGPLPEGPVSTINTKKGHLIAVALPNISPRSGLVWRLARPYKRTVLRHVSEADVGLSVVVVFEVIGAGRTSIVFAQTRGDASGKALAAITQKVHAT